MGDELEIVASVEPVESVTPQRASIQALLSRLLYFALFEPAGGFAEPC